MGEIDLIKTVRGLDQSGPGDSAENLDQLWQSLTDSSEKNFHAAEESTLRWLLKSMNGSSPAAETIRRYPLTWRILSCVFERIPLFPLAKSLVDRRFFNVLQQAVTDVSTPSSEESASSGKRKRSLSPKFSIDDLRTSEACIESGQALFSALRSLLRRVDDTGETAARDRTGAEHLKLILGTSAAEAVSIVAPLLRVCNILLVNGQGEEVEGCGRWIDDISSLWSLHLQSEDDTSEIARHVFEPSSMLLHKLEGYISKSLRERWSTDLQSLLHRSFIFPARSAFLNHNNVLPINKALTGTYSDPEHSLSLPETAPALYLLASSATEVLVQAGIRKGNVEWMKKVFEQIEEAMNNRDDRLSIMNNILRQARKRNMPVATESLQVVCRDYGLPSDRTEWTLIANLTQCDPDVFQKGDAGSQLLEDICNRSLQDGTASSEQPNITEVLSAIARGFRSARDFPSFLRLWYVRLAEIDKRETRVVGAESWQSLGSEVAPWIEKSLSVRQLAELLEWVEEQKLRPEALCLWLSAICDGVSSPTYKDALGQKVFDLALNVKKSSSRFTNLKWRILGKVLQWVPLADDEGEDSQNAKLEDNWQKIEDTLKKILKKGVISARETFEAFKCCFSVWIHVYRDGDLSKNIGKLVAKFDERLAGEAAAEESLSETLGSVANLEDGLEELLRSDFDDGGCLAHYLAWYFRGSTRLIRFVFEKTGELPLLARQVLLESPLLDAGLQILWNSFLDNESDLANGKLGEKIIDQLIASLGDHRKDSDWLESDGDVLLRSLSRIPLDSFTRSERERLVAILVDVAALRKEDGKASPDLWRLVLSLGARLMSRPVFYEGMTFAHLAAMAESVAGTASSPFVSQEARSELIERYHDLASTTIAQMAGNTDEVNLSYFKGAQDSTSRPSANDKLSALQPTLLKALRAGLSESRLRNHEQPKALYEKAEQALQSSVYCVIESWVSDKNLLTKGDEAEDLRLLAAMDASEVLTEIPTLSNIKISSLRKLERRSLEAMREGDIRGWRIQTFLQQFLSAELEIPRPASFHTLGEGREPLMRDYVGAIVKSLDTPVMMVYLEALLGQYLTGCETDGQLVAIQYVVDQLIAGTNQQGRTDDFDLATVFGELTRVLPSAKTATNAILISEILCSILEKKPHAISQWNIESLFSAGAITSSTPDSTTPFIWQCKLIEVVIKKHRVRIEGHYHILLSALQPLLRNLIQTQRASQDVKASAFTRLITLICEPTVGAVSRNQNRSALDSATDTAKRSAGRHMHLVLMQYVKLQLESDMSRPVREALEPGMNSIFGILSNDGRKILNDAMDASGRAILREMFTQYKRFGKWKGI